MRRYLPIAKPTKPRECGTCSACCVALEIPLPELDNKQAGIRCKHLKEKGCGIYDARPKVCHEFRCLWLMAKLPGADRPDRCGVVFFVCPKENLPPQENPTNEALVAAEVWPGAADQMDGKRIIHQLRRQFPILVQGAERTTKLLHMRIDR